MTSTVSEAGSRRQARAAHEAEQISMLEGLVSGWLAVPEAAERQGIALSAVRRQIQDRELIAVRRGPNRAWYIPEPFVTEEGPRPEMKGTFSVLADGGMTDLELLIWLFSADESFTGGSAMASILAGHKTEVRRRAMEEAF
ncbi:Rv2175c family DNA-binding protein [Austwickia sp. TVS 96-490-7B]|uniref:Rv2175c family DNA-binding protein n=1 Tax=Austwickia sp. TVS 96-490-7B TaxID=2830843 RepID=UPI001C560A72|nr:Rv2175c family DNA-binding protein [Austwickia sp. TVS 96-490-7B]